MRLLGVVWCALLLTGGFCSVAEPSGSKDAILIKKIDNPIFNGKVDDPEWASATLLDFNFTFANGESHRANVYLGHNGTHFFVGAVLFNVGPNPFTVPDKVVYPDGFFIYFDVDNDGELTQPEDAKGLLNNIGVYHGQVYWAMALPTDRFWESVEYPPSVRNWHERRPEVDGKIMWTADENIAASNISTHGRGYYEDGFSGDEHFEFFFPLSNKDTLSDGFQVKTGEAKTMGFALEFYRQGYDLENGTRIPDLYDFWPGNDFTPNVFINASDYAKLLIKVETAESITFDLRTLFIAAIIITILIILVWITKHKYV